MNDRPSADLRSWSSKWTKTPASCRRKTVFVIAEWSLLNSCLRAGSDQTLSVIAEWSAPYLLSESRRWSNSSCDRWRSLLTSCLREGSDRTRPVMLNDRSLPLVWEQEVIELGLHLAAERLPTVIAGTAGEDQMTGANSLAHARVGSICFTGGQRSYFTRNQRKS
jgi:hypothetical protein